MFSLINLLIVQPIVNILFAIYAFIGDFGTAIIAFTFLVKLALWPLTKQQMRQTKILRELQPELAAIRKRCNGNRQLESFQMLDLYKRKNYKPFQSFLLVLIQFPIFIALFTAINVAVRPCEVSDQREVKINSCTGKKPKTYTVEHSAYGFVENFDHISQLIEQQNQYLDAYNPDDAEAAVYEFKPQLFGRIDLSARAGFGSRSQIFIFFCAIFSAISQFFMTRMMDPSSRTGKKAKTFRQVMAEAAEGKEASQEDLNAISQRQMSITMPIMMLMIMMNLPGAICFYYLLSNCVSLATQHVALHHVYDKLDNAADKLVLKELKQTKKELSQIKEAELVQSNESGEGVDHVTRVKSTTHYAPSRKHKNSKQHITRISSSNNKKRS